ncbi:DUF605-domain-containing protein [Hyphopichia burtonii NRRL Y-1933]|uniref:DUF605-domain-containing protein n=1 Tax=Hyphopichia burtonii NRRL Y-1933 TaxID=984485 RepID=A0A1E4RP73_9ASCO|nr:DUF605-domain-containing protein [Hyphopichia burtonii NRRL Y-1933]ODV69082.1 DUF605-domain-containing protein [Hyphopichia burtonii NRRL Y-1933]
MSESLDTIPEEFKSDKTIVPFITRSNELESVNPIVSYYCKIYVLEYILNNKLHLKGGECESFTIKLLDLTESMKKSTEDESLNKVLNDKQLSINSVFSFGFKIFNSALELVSKYDGNKIALAQKLKVSIQFLSLLTIFTENGNDPAIDFGKLTGGVTPTNEEFEKFIKEKIKIAKYQLSRLIKNEIPLHSSEELYDEELEDELERELNNLDTSKPGDDVKDDDLGLPATPTFIDEQDLNLPEDDGLSLPKDEDDELGLPKTPSFIDEESKPAPNGNDLNLPGAPHFLPESDDAKIEEDSDVKLPGAPKFLPDDDLSHINKNSSIQVYPPGNSRKSSAASVPPAAKAQPTLSHSQHITKENLSQIIDKTDHIAKIQKHAKFAISALNYEDLNTAEDELLKGLEMLRSIKD